MVRVIRKSRNPKLAKTGGLVYSGIYNVAHLWKQEGEGGYMFCKYLLIHSKDYDRTNKLQIETIMSDINEYDEYY